jgi:GTPase SAR1 family protein
MFEKKVLILGLDGVGKTDLFTRLIRQNKGRAKFDPLPRPTIGKFSLYRNENLF